MSDNHINHLKELGDSKYEIVAGESDIRGWTVKNDFGRILGKVNDLILDTKAQRIKYFILDTDSNELYMTSRRVLLPLEHAELDEVYKNVIFPGLMANELSSLPTYERSSLNERTEGIVQSTFQSFRTERDANRQNFEERDSIQSEPVYSRDDNASLENKPRIGGPGFGPGNDDDKLRNRESSSAPGNNYETRFNDQYEDDTVRHQSVAGVFETRDHADVAISRLIENGFHRRDIHISFRDQKEIARGDVHENEGISGFFSNFFSSEESDWLNSDDGRKYPVVIANHLSIAEAERAAEILDRFGALNIDESLKQYQTRKEAYPQERQFRSRIIGH